MRKTVVLKVVSAIAVAGQVIRPGGLVEVTESEAKNLLHRGKCVVATEDDGVEEVDAVTVTPAAPLNPEIEAANEDAKRRAEEAAAAAAVAAATEDAPVDAQVAIGDQLVDVQIVGQAEDGSPVVTDDSAAALEAAAKAEAEAITAELAALLDDGVDSIVPLLDGLDDASLAQLRELEVGGKTRKTLIAAIDAEIAGRTPNNT